MSTCLSRSQGLEEQKQRIREIVVLPFCRPELFTRGKLLRPPRVNLWKEKGALAQVHDAGCAILWTSGDREDNAGKSHRQGDSSCISECELVYAAGTHALVVSYWMSHCWHTGQVVRGVAEVSSSCLHLSLEAAGSFVDLL